MYYMEEENGAREEREVGGHLILDRVRFFLVWDSRLWVCSRSARGDELRLDHRLLVLRC